jgi:Uma2 family endonuclease
MRGRPQRHYSVDEYFATEADSSIKHEYYKGEIFAMAGASLEHNEIAANVLALLRTALRASGCRAYGSDLRLRTPSGLFTYPDVMVICGRAERVPHRPDTVVNPVVLVEVLSDATRDYDRGDKFTLYKAITTFREYILIDQAEALVEHHQRGQRGAWRSRSYRHLNAVLKLSAVPCDLPLREVYREVFPAP